MELSRRTVLPLIGAAAVAGAAEVPARPYERIRLWPGGAPGMPAVRPVERVTPGQPTDRPRPRPRITGIADPWIERLPAARPNGAAMLIVPGGGYRLLSFESEGYAVAQRLNAAGITCYVLFHRFPGEGWADRADVPHADAQRAMRLIRARAARDRVDPDRIGIMGFSAGGHVCADLAARHVATTYAPVDAADRLSARPAIAAPLYPVVSMDPAIAHMGSRANLLGAAPTTALERAHSADVQATAANPPTFLVHAADDPSVKIDNSLRLHAALRAAAVPVEAYFPVSGGHGFGMGDYLPGAVRLWPDLFLAWAAGQGYLR